MAQGPAVNPLLLDPEKMPVIASFADYQGAQAAVDKLSDNRFPVQGVAIIGVDLKMIETVLGRMSWGRAAGGGLLTGAWFGLLLGLFVSVFAVHDGWNVWTLVGLGLIYGAGFGIIFGLVAHALTGGKRDFVSRSQIQANRYDVHVAADKIAQARQILGIPGIWPPVAEAPSPSPASATGPSAPPNPPPPTSST